MGLHHNLIVTTYRPAPELYLHLLSWYVSLGDVLQDASNCQVTCIGRWRRGEPFHLFPYFRLFQFLGVLRAISTPETRTTPFIYGGGTQECRHVVTPGSWAINLRLQFQTKQTKCLIWIALGLLKRPVFFFFLHVWFAYLKTAKTMQWMDP